MIEDSRRSVTIHRMSDDTALGVQRKQAAANIQELVASLNAELTKAKELGLKIIVGTPYMTATLASAPLVSVRLYTEEIYLEQ